MKKLSAFIFILLANIFLLVQAIIPHHHHQSEVCIVSEHCEEDAKAEEQNTHEHHHEHDNESKADYCVLNQFVLIPQNQTKEEHTYTNCAGACDSTDNLQAVLFDLKPANDDLLKEASDQEPPFELPYSLYVSSCMGLRAPPIV